jgi:ATPase
MSVHLKENNYALAKRGKPGDVHLLKISESILSRSDMKGIVEDILSQVDKREDCVIDTERESSRVLQLGKIRIVITTPPLSDAIEITAVRPIKKLSLKDYSLSEKLETRLLSRAEGILISGAPGEGKSTFIQALAESYNKKDNIIKTIEAPRDLDLPSNITRYSLNNTKPKEIYDILLLSRPDYTLFDEMRVTDDFKLFSDLRLSGVGMVGVVHATNPVDAIQRFIGRIELAIIPHVIDTVIFIKGGRVDKVFEVEMKVKVPEGMNEADLARPIVTVRDFETGSLEFEIYSYGNDTVVVPLTDAKDNEALKSWIKLAASKYISDYFNASSEKVEAEMIDEATVKLKVLRKDVARIIGKDRQNIKKAENALGVRIDVEGIEVKEEKKDIIKEIIPFNIEFSEKCIHIKVSEGFVDKTLDILIDKDYLLSAKVGKKAAIKIRMDTDVGKLVTQGIKKGKISICES